MPARSVSTGWGCYVPGFDYLEASIIRPPRHEYEMAHLGPRGLAVKGAMAQRKVSSTTIRPM